MDYNCKSRVEEACYIQILPYVKKMLHDWGKPGQTPHKILYTILMLSCSPQQCHDENAYTILPWFCMEMCQLHMQMCCIPWNCYTERKISSPQATPRFYLAAVKKTPHKILVIVLTHVLMFAPAMSWWKCIHNLTLILYGNVPTTHANVLHLMKMLCWKENI